MADEIATELVKTVREQLRPETFLAARDREREDRRVARALGSPAAGPIIRTKPSGPHVVALIGPTGVGKTTTLAKLAANLKLREQRRIGMITLDTFRIAAVDQLSKIRPRSSAARCAPPAPPKSYAELSEAMSQNEFILIDTAGRSPKRHAQAERTEMFFSTPPARTGPDEVQPGSCPVRSASRASDLAISRFSAGACGQNHLSPNSTKQAHVGVIPTVVRKGE